MQVKRIAECSKWSILQYFRPSLSIFSYQLLLRSFFCLLLSGRFTQVLLYRITRPVTALDSCILVFLFDLILYVPSTVYQLCRDMSSWIEPVLS